jgi:3-methylcrotonyl-CoA carboxylase alpha subunit
VESPLCEAHSLVGWLQGMRIVHSEADFLESLASAQRESQAAFGDSRVLIEKYVSRPRHIEVQVMSGHILKHHIV